VKGIPRTFKSAKTFIAHCGESHSEITMLVFSEYIRLKNIEINWQRENHYEVDANLLEQLFSPQLICGSSSNGNTSSRAKGNYSKGFKKVIVLSSEDDTEEDLSEVEIMKKPVKKQIKNEVKKSEIKQPVLQLTHKKKSDKPKPKSHSKKLKQKEEQQQNEEDSEEDVA
jgi:hypothetical protein